MSVESKTLSRDISEIFWKEEITLATAESCTAGNIAAILTSVPGSSKFYKGGIVAYSDEVKRNLLGVSRDTLESCGAVSEETVTAMVKGAMNTFDTDYAVATSGIAGPSGGTPDKPVGTVWIAAGNKERVIAEKICEDNGREQNVQNASVRALYLLRKLCKNEENDAER